MITHPLKSTLPLLAMASLSILSGCDRKEAAPPSSGAPSTPANTATGDDSYPKLTNMWFHEGNEVEGEGGPFGMSTDENNWKLVERMLEEGEKYGDSDKKIAFGIKRSEKNSLEIQLSPKGAEGERAVIAIWTSVAADEVGKPTVVRYTDPFAGIDEAMDLLKLYIENESGMGEAKKWTVKGRTISVPFE